DAQHRSFRAQAGRVGEGLVHLPADRRGAEGHDHPVAGDGAALTRSRGAGRVPAPRGSRRKTAVNTHYDVIIIGTGAGGGTLAWDLAPTGKRILLLERGDWVPRETQNWSTQAVVLEGRYNNADWWRDRDGKELDRKSTGVNSSHLGMSYAVFWLTK